MLIKLHRIDPRTQYTDIYVQMTAFKPFFVSLTLPYSIRRGEEFALQATVFNYLSRPLQVHITCLIMSLWLITYYHHRFSSDSILFNCIFLLFSAFFCPTVTFWSMQATVTLK